MNGTALDAATVRGDWTCQSAPHHRGRLLGTIGRPGDGPGEFRHVVDLFRSGDSILVFQLGGKVSSISPQLEVTHVAAVPGMIHRGWVKPSSELVLMGRFPAAPHAPLHRFRHGRAIGSLGAEDTVRSAERPSLTQRHVAVNDDGTLWLVRPDRYELELYDSAGALLQVYRRNAPWFPDREFEMAESPQPPSPFIVGLQISAAGDLIVLARVANEPFDSSLPRGEGVRLTPDYTLRLYDGIVEVIDPHAEAVVASHRSDMPFQGFASQDKLYSLREDEEGLVVIDIWRLDVPNGK